MKGMAFTTEDAKALLRQLMAEHNSKKRIDLEVTPSIKRTLGDTRQRRGSRRFHIRLSTYLSHDEMQDTLRHEFAHVMAGLKAGHSGVWKQWAVDVGAKPERCVPRYPALAPLHTYTCPNCENHVIQRANRVPVGHTLLAKKCGTPIDRFSYSYVDPLAPDEEPTAAHDEPPVTPAEPTTAHVRPTAEAVPRSKKSEPLRGQLPLLL